MNSKNTTTHETNTQQVVKRSQDMWENDIEIFKTPSSFFLRKIVNNKQIVFEQRQMELLFKLLKGISHPFLQTLSPKTGPSLELLFDYDTKDFHRKSFSRV